MEVRSIHLLLLWMNGGHGPSWSACMGRDFQMQYWNDRGEPSPRLPEVLDVYMACMPRLTIHSECWNFRLASRKFATRDWQKIRRDWWPRLHWVISGQCVVGFWTVMLGPTIHVTLDHVGLFHDIGFCFKGFGLAREVAATNNCLADTLIALENWYRF